MSMTMKQMAMIYIIHSDEVAPLNMTSSDLQVSFGGRLTVECRCVNSECGNKTRSSVVTLYV